MDIDAVLIIFMIQNYKVTQYCENQKLVPFQDEYAKQIN